MQPGKDSPAVAFPDFKSWLTWLEKNHANAPELWVKIAKKGAAAKTATYEELREGALMYGWIDGLTRTVDERFYVIRFTPRRPKGNWSKINRGIVEELIAAGKMRPSGMVHVDTAKQDGRWDRAI